jgi:hypothetical protein
MTIFNLKKLRNEHKPFRIPEHIVFNKVNKHWELEDLYFEINE